MERYSNEMYAERMRRMREALALKLHGTLESDSPFADVRLHEGLIPGVSKVKVFETPDKVHEFYSSPSRAGGEFTPFVVGDASPDIPETEIINSLKNHGAWIAPDVCSNAQRARMLDGAKKMREMIDSARASRN